MNHHILSGFSCKSHWENIHLHPLPVPRGRETVATVSYSLTSTGRLDRAGLEVSAKLGIRTRGNIVLFCFTSLLKTQDHKCFRNYIWNKYITNKQKQQQNPNQNTNPSKQTKKSWTHKTNQETKITNPQQKSIWPKKRDDVTWELKRLYHARQFDTALILSFTVKSELQ